MQEQTEEYTTTEEAEVKVDTEPEAETPGERKRLRDHFGARVMSFLIVAVLALVAFLIVNAPAVARFFESVGVHIAPLAVGAAMAYLCAPILRFYENKLFGGISRKGLRRGLSLALTLISILAALALIMMMIIPQLIDSIRTLIANYDDYLDELLQTVQGFLDRITADLPVDVNISSKERLISLIDGVFGSVEEFYNSVILPAMGGADIGDLAWSAVGGVVTFLKNFFLGLFIAFYILASKEKRVGQINKFRRATLKPETDRKLTSFVSLVDQSFGGFIYGKLIDSLIIGVLTFGLMTVLEVSPYNLLIATFVGLTNVIPVFGPFIGAIPSFLIVLISNPSKAFLFLLLILIVQQLDGNVIGPKILGDNVGVSSLTVLIAITICGSLWGVLGMLIGVPLFAVIIEMVRRGLEQRLVRKGAPTDTMDYYPADSLVDAEKDVYYEHAGMRYRYEHGKLKPRVDRWLAKMSRGKQGGEPTAEQTTHDDTEGQTPPADTPQSGDGKE